MFAGKSIVLLVGGLAIGWMAGAGGIAPLDRLFFDLFKGVLAFFLLEMGLVVARRFGELRRAGIFLMVFAVAPGGSAIAWNKTLLTATLLGFFAYATYDLTNLATLKNWPIGLTVLDMVWGTVLSVVATSAGKVVWDRFAIS